MDLLKLKAKIGIDTSEYDKGLSDSESKLSKVGQGIKKGLGVLGAASAAAIGVAATGIGVLTKQSISAYSETEQLVGGVQKLYGNMGQSVEEYAASTGRSVDEVKGEWQSLEDAQNLVLDNAKNAYKTAGMDMNTYMQNATSFSAALINSLGGDTVEAAKQTDVAMRAISDNVNTFGSDMGSVTNAFQGFAKQNYTMLDNLKLGYGGTKEEMERLITDANAWGEANGKASNLSIDSFSDVVTAIEQIQEAQGIAGTTTREAATTIQGSLGMTKAAWDNLVAGFTDPNADLGQLMDNLIVAIVGDKEGEGLLNNIIPAIEHALEGISKFIEKAIPVIGERLPELLQSILPSLLTAATQLVVSLVAALPELINIIGSALPTIIPILVSAIVDTLPALIEGIVTLMTAIAEVLPDIIPLIVDALIQCVPVLIDAIFQIQMALIAALPEIIQALIAALPEIIMMIVNALIQLAPMLLTVGVELVKAIWEGLKLAFPEVTGWIEETWNKVVTFFTDIWNAISVIFETAVNFISAVVEAVFGVIKQVIEIVMSAIYDFLAPKLQAIKDTFTKIFNAIYNFLAPKLQAIKNVFTTVFNAVKSFIDTTFGTIKSTITSILTTIYSTIDSKLTSIKNTFTTIFDGIKSYLSPVIEWLKGIFDFEWNLPQIKLPHFSISGSFSLKPPSVPSFNVEWYKKAMDKAYLLNGATIFGEMGGNLLGGGEAGSEMVIGTDTLVDVIRQATSGLGDYNQTVNITVYGAEGQDVRELADIISERIHATTNRQMVAMGMV